MPRPMYGRPKFHFDLALGDLFIALVSIATPIMGANFLMYYGLLVDTLHERLLFPSDKFAHPSVFWHL